MSTLKKVISLVLCAAILVGSFALVGNIAPAASAADAVSKIDSYADLVATYGQGDDIFVYAGLEFYEADGKLTDYYVEAGEELTVRAYIKSNAYIGESYLHSFYENSFFDVKLAGGPGATLAATGYTSNFSGAVINAAHPIKVNNNASHVLTSINSAGAGWIKNTCGFTTEYLAATDLVKSNTKTDVTTSSVAYDATSDEWLFEYYVKVKDGLADGTKGIVSSPDVIWQSFINPDTNKHDTKKQSYIPVLDPAKLAAGSDKLTNTTTMAAAMDSGILDTFIKEDLEHEFTIGVNPEAGGSGSEETKYTVTFYAEDESVIETVATYVDGAAVEFPVAVENQIGWAVVGKGKSGEIVTEYTIQSADVEFLRVLSTSKFPVDIALNAKAAEINVDAEKLEAAGAEYIADKAAIRVMLSIGETFDLATIEDAISKLGSEFAGWDTEDTTITLETVNGALGTKAVLAPKAEWEANIYTINFYADKDSVGTADPVFSKEVKYNEKASYGAITNANADMKFAGWYNAADDSFISEKNGYAFTVTEDIDVYAAWSEYKNVATFYVRDYANGNWVEFNKNIDKNEAETATIAKDKVAAVLKDACADANIKFMGLYATNPDEITDGNYASISGFVDLGSNNYMTADLTYSGHQAYYIATTYACEVTWMVPVYDEATGTFDEANATVALTDKVNTAAYATDSANPYKAASKFNKTVTAPTGYALAYWKDAATGEKVEFNANGAYEIDATTQSATLIAVFDLVEYKIAFNLRNSSGNADIVMMTNTVTLGEEIAIDGAEFTLNGNATVLPKAGVDNADQEDGGYALLEGYKFAGWSFGTDSNAATIEFPVELTADIIKRYFANGVININAMWDAEEFTITFYITNKDGEEEEFKSHTVKVGEDIAKYRTVTAEIAAAVNEKAPDGKVFSNIWYNKETNAPDTTLTKMPAKDIAYYAAYNAASVKVYVDYNFLAEENLAETMSVFRVEGKDLLLVGADIAEVKEDAPYLNRSFQTMVMRSVNTNNSPEEPSEIVSWNVYHVDAGKDVNDKANWKPGVNDEGTTIAQTTLVFQPVWMAHKDMLFRFHDTDGDIYFAISKKFSFHYWNKGTIVEKYSDTVINTNPEDNIVLFFTIEDVSNFSFRLDAFPIPKYIFTPDGMIAFFQMIPTLLESLLG